MESIVKAKKQAQSLAKTKGIKLKQALDLVAKENRFSSWKDYKDSLDTFWYQKSSPFLNHWFTLYAEAVEFRNSNSGYLLTYKGQYFVASSDYVERLGIDPDADIWKKINYDVSSSTALAKVYEFFK